jgi:hypothetical protein
MNEPDIEPRPCGYQGQSLPSFGSDDASANEEESEEKEEDKKSDTELGERRVVQINGDLAEKEEKSRKDIKIPTQDEVDESKIIEAKILEGTTKRSGSKQTSGRTIQYDTSMYDTLQEAIDAAKEKFKLAQPIDVVPIDKGERGCLPDGRRINWRWGSTEGSPTVEIHNPRNDKKIKIRFANKESMQ